MDSNQIKEGYRDLFIRSDNKIANHLVQTMYKKHDALIGKAERSSDPTEAFGFLKEAHGIIKVLDHIKTQTGKELRRDQS